MAIEYEENTTPIKAANIMLIGRTGVGKSSLINYLIGKDVSVTGFGKPVTDNFDEFEYEADNGFKINIYDSKGLEVNGFKEAKQNIAKFAKEKSGNKEFSKWLHTIFYCINIKRSRLEDAEVNFIKELGEKLTQRIHIVVTHCNLNDNNETMMEHIKSRLGTGVNVYCVNSVEEETRNGTNPAFGKENLLSSVFETLWRDISYKVSSQYAHYYVACLRESCAELRENCLDLLDGYSTMDLIKKFTSNEDVFDDIDFEFDTVMRKMKKDLKVCQGNLYKEHLSQAVGFFNNYNVAITGTDIDLLNINDFDFVDLRLKDDDNLFKKTRLGKFIEEADAIDDDSILSMIKIILKGGFYVLRLQSLIREIIEEGFNNIEEALPSEDELQSRIENILVKALCKNY